MRIQGHSATDGRHSAGWQKDRMRDAPQKEQGRHILAIDSRSEMQAKYSAVTGRHRSDRLAARHLLAG